jgi:hypothetical protein
LCMVLQDRVEPYLDSIIAKLIILLNSISKVRHLNSNKLIFNKDKEYNSL